MRKRIYNLTDGNGTVSNNFRSRTRLYPINTVPPHNIAGAGSLAPRITSINTMGTNTSTAGGNIIAVIGENLFAADVANVNIFFNYGFVSPLVTVNNSLPANTSYLVTVPAYAFPPSKTIVVDVEIETTEGYYVFYNGYTYTDESDGIPQDPQ